MTTSTRSTSTRAIPSPWGSLGLGQLPVFGHPNFFYTGAYYNTNVASGDVNGDGKADLVYHQLRLLERVSVMLGNGDGTFNFPGVFYAGHYPQAVAVGDVTGDGKADLVVTHLYDGVWVFPGDGSGGFGSPSSFGGATNMPYVTLADVNGDAVLDIITANYDSSTVSVFLNDGSGSFTRTDYSAGMAPHPSRSPTSTAIPSRTSSSAMTTTAASQRVACRYFWAMAPGVSEPHHLQHRRALVRRRRGRFQRRRTSRTSSRPATTSGTSRCS